MWEQVGQGNGVNGEGLLISRKLRFRKKEIDDFLRRLVFVLVWLTYCSTALKSDGQIQRQLYTWTNKSLEHLKKTVQTT